MAGTAIVPTYADYPGDDGLYAKTAQWTPLTTSNDTGTPIHNRLAAYMDRTVQVTGTFGAAATVVLEGSNDGVNYATLTDPAANAISFTAAGLKQVTEAVLTARPRLVSGGDGSTSITVTVMLRRSLR